MERVSPVQSLDISLTVCLDSVYKLAQKPSNDNLLIVNQQLIAIQRGIEQQSTFLTRQNHRSLVNLRAYTRRVTKRFDLDDKLVQAIIQNIDQIMQSNN